jgi:hypothetical protein
LRWPSASKHEDQTVTVKTILGFATEAAVVAAAFFIRNAIVLIVLSLFAFIALSRA